MKLITNPALLQKEMKAMRKKGKAIGFVPTMGALHEGHLSLIRKARGENDIVVASIFVNPLQFGPREDFKKYPRSLARDIALCKKYVDIIFTPQAKDLYPEGFLTKVEVEKLSSMYCGASRPGHFRGVATIVNKLFNIALPDTAYFGQKDAQQAVLIQKMVSDLNMPVTVKVCATVREPDGLALSSRNAYLSQQERKDAVVLYRSLLLAKTLAKSKQCSSAMIIARMRGLINKVKSARVDYISIVDSVTFEPLWQIKKGALVLMAVYIGKTRLIDNMRIRD